MNGARIGMGTIAGETRAIRRARPSGRYVLGARVAPPQALYAYTPKARPSTEKTGVFRGNSGADVPQPGLPTIRLLAGGVGRFPCRAILDHEPSGEEELVYSSFDRRSPCR
ncbi:MAG: hypothetical protein LBK73_12760 [Treponema sp.]|nr:hypothetical protein [Treponema sp.]